jgi:hypothetical protein
MKNITIAITVILCLVFTLYHSAKAEKKIKEKDEQIRELEFQVWSLKLDKRLDSIKDYHVELFNKKMDSIFKK